MNIYIDATNVGGGGGVTHLKEILNDAHLSKSSFDNIYIYASSKVLKNLPNNSFIFKITHPFLNSNFLMRFIFQYFLFDKIVRKNCDILFSITGDYLGSFRPVVGMSRNMLLYDKKTVSEFKSIFEKLKFDLSFFRQKKSFEKSIGVIFISKAAQSIASKFIDFTGVNTVLIHHGISSNFSSLPKKQYSINHYSFSHPFNFLYVSTVHLYKHQWNIVKVIGELRNEGYPVSLTLIGGSIFLPAEKLLIKTIDNVDPNREFIDWKGNVEYSQINKIYKQTDGIIFASTCENMPNILIESMYSGSAIACSDKQPMPEFLKNSGFYFDSHSISSIKSSLKFMLNNPEIREKYIIENQKEVKIYSWDKTSCATFDFIQDCFYKYNKNVQK
ncbi:glycosyltransferase [Algoriphagus sp. C2-6-M1]|uniref:glycosyltransferase n=1 Tax=Algoriphagus persicinus TaxID=3108754 RepID=UPI002B37BECF|nr:glycosyltransferase [Algoriphagus sp. C2-6-M1]MEB2781267.1 glycosyltransferase [Algoriphagus sp. C2-6-M1]